MINFALIGAGKIGQIHAANIASLPDATLHTVADISIDAAQRLADSYNAKATDNIKAIIASSEIDAVLIASSTDTHYELSCHAIDHSKAIFCEKPIDLNIDRAKDIVERVVATNRFFMVGFNRRFDPNFAALKQRLPQIGKLDQLFVTSRDPSPPPAEYVARSGGLFRDMTIHDFDIAMWLAGQPITEVSATASCRNTAYIGEAGDYDTAIITLTFADGSIGQINNSRSTSYGYDQRIEAFGPKGKLLVENPTTTTLTFENEQGEKQDKIYHFFLERYENAYKNQLAVFCQAYITKQASPTPANDGFNALVVAEASEKSLQQKKTVYTGL